MHIDPVLPEIMKVLAVIVGLSLILRRFGQPGPVAYILAGIILGPYVLKLNADIDTMARIGSFGVIFLLFFAGQEISVKQITSNWKISLIGTLTQILVSLGLVYLLGLFLGWSWQSCILLGFCISLSSTAIILNVLEEKKLFSTPVAKDVITILVSQDLALVPMLMILGALGDSSVVENVSPWMQLIGGLVLIGSIVITKIAVKRGLPVLKFIKDDPELQFFVPILICLLFSFITGYFGISTALGAFIAGIITTSLGEKEWFHKTLEPFKILFVGLFFVSVGIMLDPIFIWKHLWVILTVTFVAFTVNTSVNTSVFRALGRPFGESLYSGALLGQIGEFAFVLASIGLNLKIINSFSYQLVISITGISLFLTPTWTFIIEKTFGVFSKQEAIEGETSATPENRQQEK